MTTKTYLLAPNFDFAPGGPIGLGSLLVDALSPHRALAELPKEKWPEVVTTTVRGRVIANGKGYETGVSTGSQMLKIIGAKVEASGAADASVEYSMCSLRTEYFRGDPSDDDLKKLLEVPRVQRAMEIGLWARPLYLITAIKIAEGFAMSTSTKHNKSAIVGIEDTSSTLQGISVGLKGSASKSHSDKFEADHAVILAYRLLRIRRKGWREQWLKTEEYKPKSAFLGQESEKEEEIELEVLEITSNNIAETVDEDSAAEPTYLVVNDE